MEAYKAMEILAPITQTVEAVKGLLTWRGRAIDPLPEFVELETKEGRLVLVLSNKKDAYYTVTPKACSCPASTYNPGQACKHRRKHFPEESHISHGQEESFKSVSSIIPRTPFKPFMD